MPAFFQRCETHEEMYHILDEVVPYLPQEKPVYLMGVGTPLNILEYRYSASSGLMFAYTLTDF